MLWYIVTDCIWKNIYLNVVNIVIVFFISSFSAWYEIINGAILFPDVIFPFTFTILVYTC